ncbi:MAG: hypothetical protein JSU63_20820 [Phycisphaerales bacterium]|nr:MAG: hypothetical protein JSU63_20820 [Phycisphaerales bacterium]
MSRFQAGRKLNPVLPGLFALAGWHPALSVAWGQTRDLGDDLGRLNVRHSTEHYRLAGTVSDVQLAEFGRCLEYIYTEYAKGFGKLLDKPSDDTASAEDKRFDVVILAKQKEYEEFRQAYFGVYSEHTSGLYIPRAQLLLISAAGPLDETYEVIFHEAFHQFVDRFIPAMPTWVNEGLATYYGTARPTKGGLVFDRPRRGFFRIVRDATSAKKLIPFEELLSYDRASFYQRDPIEGVSFDRRILSYAQSYTLCAYLLSDSGGRKHLQKYLRALAQARNTATARQATLESFPAKLLESLVPGWLEFVNRN